MAQKRRQALLEQRKQRRITALCIAGGVGIAALSLIISLLVFDIGGQEDAPVSAPVATALPYTATQPFTLADLTSDQQAKLRTQGQITVSDGPRGISIGDTLDTVLSRFPSTFSEAQPTDEAQILYCADYFLNANGQPVALPPRGMLTVESRNLLVVLLAPTSAYPAGTRDGYSDFEHVYCIFSIEPESMTVETITLGIEA